MRPRRGDGLRAALRRRAARRLRHVRRVPQHRVSRQRSRRAAGSITACDMARFPAHISDQHALAGSLEDRDLAEGADLVDARVGARIAEEHEPGVEQHANAVRHCCDADVATLTYHAQLIARVRRRGVHRAPVPRRGSRGRPRAGNALVQRARGPCVTSTGNPAAFAAEPDIDPCVARDLGLSFRG